MNEPITIERADNLRLSNDAKIRACNFFHAMQKHLGDCDECCLYLYHGDGDLCEAGKTILVRELVYTDMSIELPPNDALRDRRANGHAIGDSGLKYGSMLVTRKS